MALKRDGAAGRVNELGGKEQPLPGKRPLVDGLTLGDLLFSNDVGDFHPDQLAAAGTRTSRPAAD